MLCKAHYRCAIDCRYPPSNSVCRNTPGNYLSTGFTFYKYLSLVYEYKVLELMLVYTIKEITSIFNMFWGKG